MKIIFQLVLLCILISCGRDSSKKSSLEKQNVSPIFNSKELNVQVFYETGAEPYTDNLGVLDIKIWDVFQVNMNALFEGKGITIKVPKTLEEMTKMAGHNKETWTIEEVLDMGKNNATTEKSGSTNFQIFFVNGFAQESPNIIGYNISHSKVIVIFKAVVKNSSGAELVVPKYVEQATLVHEMGHALGLVNNGLPMISAHQDKEHGAHCSNPNCVMYYSNEGAANLVNYVSKIKEEKNLIMFDQQCLDDARKY
jgi:predicted Zn-dependent protease